LTSKTGLLIARYCKVGLFRKLDKVGLFQKTGYGYYLIEFLMSKYILFTQEWDIFGCKQDSLRFMYYYPKGKKSTFKILYDTNPIVKLISAHSRLRVMQVFLTGMETVQLLAS